MAVRLKTHTKVLLAMVVLSGGVAGAWALGLGDLVMGGDEDPTIASNTVENNGGGWSLFGGNSETSGPLGTKGNPLKVSIVSFHGYAPALVANGGSLTTQPGSIFENNSVNVEFVIQDNVPTLTEIFESNTAHCSWRTSDFWAQEHPNLRRSGFDARGVLVVDNTQGADAIIARDSSIQSFEDLAGHSVAMLEFTPSHGMFTYALNNSSLSKRKRQSIDTVFVDAEEGTGGVAAMFQSGAVDAAVLWDPDLSLVMVNTPGSHVIYSTEYATDLIYDVIVCDTRYLDSNPDVFQGFVNGWLEGVTAAESRPDLATSALVNSEPMFAQLASSTSQSFIPSLYENIDWTDLADNARILGLDGSTNNYESVYREFDGIYRSLGALADPNSPVINPQESFDYRFINAALQANPSARTKAKASVPTFTPQERATAVAQPSRLTKPVEVSFKTGSADLNKRAQDTIDNEMVPMLEQNGSAYVVLSGNTDTTGGAAGNKALSLRRARSVADYLVSEWDFPRDRFEVVGNGEDAPICDESNPASEGLTLDECRALNRTVRLSFRR